MPSAQRLFGPILTRANVEAALWALRSKGTPTAEIVFATMASAAQAGRSDRGGREVYALIVDYVAEVADIWRSAGLRPTRVFNRSSVGKRSKFHHFVDLVLTAIVEPQSRRHDSNLDGSNNKFWRLTLDCRTACDQKSPRPQGIVMSNGW